MKSKKNTSKKSFGTDAEGTFSELSMRDRIVPQNLDAERGVLGSILVDPGRVMDICLSMGLTPEAFVDPAYRSIYTVIEGLVSKGQPVDEISIATVLRAMGEFDRVGGIGVLTDLIRATPAGAHATYYAEQVMEQYVRRSILGATRNIEEEVYNPSLNVDYVLGNAEQSILRLGEERSKAGGSLASWKDSVAETMTALERQMSTHGALSGLPTGFKLLDDKLRGLHKGEMIVLAARPSMGKTSLAMNIAECVARGRDIFSRPFKEDDGQVHKHGVLVFSLEMTQVQLTTRMLCGLAGVSAFEIERGLVKRDMAWRQLQAAAEELESLPVRCDDQSGLDVLELRARARHIAKKMKVELVVIDYLQLLGHREYAKQGQQVMVSKISGEIKAMAKELNCPVLILSQLSRNPEQRQGADAKPKCSDLRDSGAIEQDADVIMLLRRPSRMGARATAGEPVDERLAIVDVAKNRNGPVGEVELNFDGSLTRFSDRFSHMAGPSGDEVAFNEPPKPQE